MTRVPRRLAPLLRYLLGLRAWSDAERQRLTHVARDCYHAGYAAGYPKGIIYLTPLTECGKI